MTVNFWLGVAIGLSSRLVTITKLPGAKDPSVPPYPQYYQQSLPGADDKLTVSDLPDNQMLQITVLDTIQSSPGEPVVTKGPSSLIFQTTINPATLTAAKAGGQKGTNDFGLQVTSMLTDADYSGGSNTGSAVGSGAV